MFSTSLIVQADSCTCIGNDFFFSILCMCSNESFSWRYFSKSNLCVWQELCHCLRPPPLLLYLFCPYCFFPLQYCSSTLGLFGFSGLHFCNWRIFLWPVFNHEAHMYSLYFFLFCKDLLVEREGSLEIRYRPSE